MAQNAAKSPLMGSRAKSLNNCLRCRLVATKQHTRESDCRV